jgi:3-hydroxyacyl-CoA dehydrogenase / enoyl-CoA hydratase / 3-hydroxybutyryl-CoA epimerase
MNHLVLDPTENPAEDFDSQPSVSFPSHVRHEPACFRKEIDAEGVCWLTFDTPGASANVWNLDTLDEFDRHLEDLHRDHSVRALVIRSAKERVFIAGADLKAVQTLTGEDLHHLLALGQDVFTHLESLRIPKVALIHGACVGGGFEMTLACDWRIGSTDESTRIGLPETQLGLIPAWGGCTRLSRLIGLPRALDLILRGKTYSAAKAKQLGLIHEVVPAERLDEFACKFVKQPTKTRPPHFHATQLWPVPQLLRFQAKSKLVGKFPWMKDGQSAQMLAVDVITQGASRTFENALALEQHTVEKLAGSNKTRRLIDFFLRKEAASKKLPADYRGLRGSPVTNISVIGAGVMGAGIAYVLAAKGNRVLVSDTSLDALSRGVERLSRQIQSAKRHEVLSSKQARDLQDRLSFTHEEVPLQGMDLVIEAVVEDMAVKKKLLADLAARCCDQTILASNTSALSITEMARGVPHPERVIGLHFFNPAPLMPLVEVVRHEGSSPEVTARAMRLVQSLGKTPVLVQDQPGFVVNRILMPYLMGAVSLAENMRDPWELDDAMLEFGMPMGPLRLLDEIGFDVALHVEATLRKALGTLPHTELLQKMVQAEMLGRKNGEGFYLNHEDKNGAQPNHKLLPLLKPISQARFKTRSEIIDHLHGLMQTEAQRCLEEGVAANRSDIELAMTLGAGFPPFQELFPVTASSTSHPLSL